MNREMGRRSSSSSPSPKRRKSSSSPSPKRRDSSSSSPSPRKYSPSSLSSESPSPRRRSRSPRKRSPSPRRDRRHSEKYRRSSSPKRARSRSSSPRRSKPFVKKRRGPEDEEDVSQYEYGMNSSASTTQPENREGEEDKKKNVPKEKPNFSLSGKLSEEQRTTANGAILKFVEPPDAKKPLPGWRLYPFKNETPLDPIHLHKQSAYLFGRDRGVCDVPLDHTSISKQHAVIQFRAVDVPTADGLSTKKVVRPYIMDLESTNGTFLNKEKLPTSRYVELKDKDVLNFGFSTRDYVVIHE